MEPEVRDVLVALLVATLVIVGSCAGCSHLAFTECVTACGSTGVERMGAGECKCNTPDHKER